MSTTVLLISVNQCTTPYPVFPLGLSHVGGALRAHGYQVVMADMNFDASRLENIIELSKPDFIGLSLRNIDDHRIDGPVYFVPDVLAVVKRIRSVTDIALILGGSAFSLFPEELLCTSGADFGIVGEGDEAMPMLIGILSSVAASAREAHLMKVPGLVFRRGSTIVQNVRHFMDAGRIAPIYCQSNIIEYYQKNCGVVNVQTQRGCPFSCCYCTYPLIDGSESRFRDASAVVDEMEAAVRQGARYFFIVDSVFNADNRHVDTLCKALLRRDLGISWGCFLRPHGLTREIVELMAAAGLRHVEFGTDSLCDATLAAYGKGFTVADVIESDALVHAAGIRHAHFLICGGPGETEATLNESFANSLYLKKTVVFPFVGMRLYPGTQLYKKLCATERPSEPSSLLQPFFHITPGLTKEYIAGLLRSFHDRSPRWIVDDPSPEQQLVIERLRAKNIPGPLWEFLAE